ncbi:disease resistance protein RPV1-like [Prosopis cineraria]|uniref:disease resistance protein RPV1-like n=1 Tax=Prosopis cineraria TaxID=364024 RepID=UPI002410053F|nr:disease resistance protein RPV1-like [Prosopis cineraria]
MQKLNRPSSTALANIVGINKNCDRIELFLERFSTIGIWGMGGIGKTTMAKVVFAKFRSQFDSCCFLENLREESEKHGLKYIHDKLLFELSNDTFLERLSRKKVLIVLDDVSNTSQLEYLENEAPRLGLGSKVIITSRDQHVLDERVDKIHKAIALNYDSSLQLFNLKAFRKNGYKSEYKKLVEKVVAYAKGNPLALTILGSFLHSKTIKEWESALVKLEKRTYQDIQAVLKLSYDGLDDEEKEMFLDIACFLKGESKGDAITTLEGCGFHASIGLRTLMDKALISIDYDTVQMHDLIQSMALEIVRQENIKDPGRRSRLWNPDEIYDVLKNNQGSDAIHGIILNLSEVRDIQLSIDTFKKMTNLRFLKFYSPRDERSCIVNLPSGLDSFSNSLRYLQWDKFPLESLPSLFCAEKLVELRMPNSNLEKLWDGVQNLVNLRNIDLTGSKQLIELPDFSAAQNLEVVYLSSCERLCHLHPSILSLPRLHDLKLSYCKNLKSLKMESHSNSLSSLLVNGCYSLKEFSFSSNKLLNLDLLLTGIEILDLSMGHMEQLQQLSLNGLTLKNLPVNEICCLRSLRELYLYGCIEIIDKSKLHILFDALLYLESIDLDGACRLTELPNNIKHLSRLKSLYINNCKSLQSLPEFPPSIERLNACNCISLKTLQLTSHFESSLLANEIISGSTLCSSISYLRNLWDLDLSGCEQLHELPEIINSLSSLSSLDLEGSNVESLPANIKHLSNLTGIWLRNCKRLRTLPRLPPSIETINTDDCISLEIVPPSITCMPQLTFLSLKHCLKLENRFYPML